MSRTYSTRPVPSLVAYRKYEKKNGSTPIKLRISHDKKRKEYGINLDLPKADFDKAWKTERPRGQYRQTRMMLDEIVRKADEIIDGIDPFSFRDFEEQFFRNAQKEEQDVFSLYERTIERLRETDRLKTADSYRTSLNKLKQYLEEKKGPLPSQMDFEEITPDFLEDFERYMTEERGHSRTTVGIYGRALKAIFNEARDEGITEHYPFGRRKYQTPNTKRTKKALSEEELKTLINSEGKTKEQEKARDLFLLSFYLKGINMKDFAGIRNKDLEGDRLTFYRSKTHRTTKEGQRPIKVGVHEKARKILDKYRGKDLRPDAPVLNILSIEDDAETRRRKVDRAVRFVNQHLKPLAKANGLPEGVSYQWARHTFATLSMNKGGATMEYVSQALGHSDIKTTEAYIDGFDDEQDDAIMDKTFDV